MSTAGPESAAPLPATEPPSGAVAENQFLLDLLAGLGVVDSADADSSLATGAGASDSSASTAATSNPSNVALDPWGRPTRINPFTPERVGLLADRRMAGLSDLRHMEPVAPEPSIEIGADPGTAASGERGFAADDVAALEAPAIRPNINFQALQRHATKPEVPIDPGPALVAAPAPIVARRSPIADGMDSLRLAIEGAWPGAYAAFFWIGLFLLQASAIIVVLAWTGRI